MDCHQVTTFIQLQRESNKVSKIKNGLGMFRWK